MQEEATNGRSRGIAVEELKRDETSRKRFLTMAGVGAASSFAILLAACGDDDEDSGAQNQQTQPAKADSAVEQFGQGDLGIANYALTLEFLEADFYKQVEDSGLFRGEQLDLIKLIGQNEEEHVAALTNMVKQAGGTPADKPTTKFESVLEGGADMVLKTAAQVENVGAAAYLGQADKIQDKEILAAALSIHTVEGRHAAVLNDLVGEPFVPDGAFAKPMDAQSVLDAVKPFIVS